MARSIVSRMLFAATKAAVEEGIVAGGGTALINLALLLKSLLLLLAAMKRLVLLSFSRLLEEPAHKSLLTPVLKEALLSTKSDVHAWLATVSMHSTKLTLT